MPRPRPVGFTLPLLMALRTTAAASPAVPVRVCAFPRPPLVVCDPAAPHTVKGACTLLGTAAPQIWSGQAS
ncbi:MAG: hypothetical protein ACPIOQ_81175 [Promethearchaeia archaeon]